MTRAVPASAATTEPVPLVKRLPQLGLGDSAEGALERGGRELIDRQAVDVTVSAEALEGPGQVGLHWHADRATRGDDAEQDARTVRALGAAGEHMRVHGSGEASNSFCANSPIAAPWLRARLISAWASRAA